MRQATPLAGVEKATTTFVEKFTPGYIQRALASWPKQGSRPPWRVHQNYFRDKIALQWSPIDDGVLEFSNPAQPAPTRDSLELAEAAR